MPQAIWPFWPRIVSGTPGTVAPVEAKFGVTIRARYQIPGAENSRWGSFARIGIPDFVRVPEITHAFDALSLLGLRDRGGDSEPSSSAEFSGCRLRDNVVGSLLVQAERAVRHVPDRASSPRLRAAGHPAIRWRGATPSACPDQRISRLPWFRIMSEDDKFDWPGAVVVLNKGVYAAHVSVQRFAYISRKRFRLLFGKYDRSRACEETYRSRGFRGR